MNKLDQLDIDVKRLTIQVHQLTQSIEELKVICSRMDNHITFVEATYDTLRTPLDYIKSYFKSGPYINEK